MSTGRPTTTDSWVARFAERLIEVLPSLSYEGALDIGYSEYLVNCDAMPETIADDYATLEASGWLQRPA